MMRRPAFWLFQCFRPEQSRVRSIQRGLVRRRCHQGRQQAPALHDPIRGRPDRGAHHDCVDFLVVPLTLQHHSVADGRHPSLPNAQDTAFPDKDVFPADDRFFLLDEDGADGVSTATAMSPPPPRPKRARRATGADAEHEHASSSSSSSSRSSSSLASTTSLSSPSSTSPSLSSSSLSSLGRDEEHTSDSPSWDATDGTCVSGWWDRFWRIGRMDEWHAMAQGTALQGMDSM